jgi:hypothetical protein
MKACLELASRLISFFSAAHPNLWRGLTFKLPDHRLDTCMLYAFSLGFARSCLHVITATYWTSPSKCQGLLMGKQTALPTCTASPKNQVYCCHEMTQTKLF